jgi:LytS/YehU family sensor histidine kinase
MLPRFVIPYLIGLVSAPVVTRIVQPIARSAVKTTIEFGMQARKLAAQAAEDLQDLVAETSAEMAAAEIEKKSGASANGSTKR